MNGEDTAACRNAKPSGPGVEPSRPIGRRAQQGMLSLLLLGDYRHLVGGQSDWEQGFDGGLQTAILARWTDLVESSEEGRVRHAAWPVVGTTANALQRRPPVDSVSGPQRAGRLGLNQARTWK